MNYQFHSSIKNIVTIGATIATAIFTTASYSDDDPHAHHRMMMQSDKPYTRSIESYDIPKVDLLDQHGTKLSTEDIFSTDDPIIVSYIFTTCATICPVLTATLASAKSDLSDINPAPKIISISIDPEEDTPANLARYAQKFNAGENWTFLTGELDDIVNIQRAMHVYRGSKLNHEPVTFIRPEKHSPWVRIDGFTGATGLVKEYRAAVHNLK